MTYSIDQLKAAADQGFKYKVRAERYENYKSSATFDPVTVHGRSYGWWAAVVKIGPFVVFNACHYSSCTSKHLRKMRHVMSELGIKIDFEIHSHGGLERLVDAKNQGFVSTNHYYSSSAETHYLNEIAELRSLISKKGTRKATNARRAFQLVEAEQNLEVVYALNKLKTAKGVKRTALIRKLRSLKAMLERNDKAYDKLIQQQYKEERLQRAERDARKAQQQPTLSVVV